VIEGIEYEPDGEKFRLGMTRLPLGDWLVPRLLAGTVRMIPFGTIVTILAVFVVLVGPLEWYLLGYLRKRKWTWIVFPATSAAVTLFMVVLSRWYLGTSDQYRSLVLIDVGPDGAAQRENRFDLTFAATPARLVHEAGARLLQPMATPAEEETPWASGEADSPWEAGGGEDARFRGGISAGLRGASEPVEIEGRFPQAYSLRQSVSQWKAQVNRSLSFAPADDRFSPRWEEFQAFFPSLDSHRPIDEGLVERFLGGRNLRCRIVVLYLDRMLEWNPEGKGFRRHRPLPSFISVHPGSGLFDLVTAISPTGSGNLEDLDLLDPTDPDEFLLLVEREAGDTMVVHRKLYRRGE